MKRPYHTELREPRYADQLMHYTCWDAYCNESKVGAFIHKSGVGLHFYPDHKHYSVPVMAKISAMMTDLQEVCKYLRLGTNCRTLRSGRIRKDDLVEITTGPIRERRPRSCRAI
jgi:hypothetical protein